MRMLTTEEPSVEKKSLSSSSVTDGDTPRSEKEYLIAALLIARPLLNKMLKLRVGFKGLFVCISLRLVPKWILVPRPRYVVR